MQMRIVEGMAGVNSREALYAALQQFHKVLRLLDKGQQDLVCHGGPCTGPEKYCRGRPAG